MACRYNEQMQFETLAIVGVGLLGGSIGLAAKSRGLVRRVIGIGRDEDRLKHSQRQGAIDEFARDFESVIPQSDLIIVCTPVDLIVEQVQAISHLAKPESIITDVGSTKQTIVAALSKSMTEGATFVGSHPMAGSEKKGSEYANANLFVNRVTIMTPTEPAPRDRVERLKGFWESLGSRVVYLTPHEHDRAVAQVSHLPHAVATALAGCVDPRYLEFSAGGFRDTTRIAAAGSAIWEPIFQANRDEVLAACERFALRFEEFRALLSANDRSGLIRWLNEGKQVRDALGS